MEVNKLRTLILAVCCLAGFTGCSDDDGSWYDSVPGGGDFERGNTVQFYYIDENGNDLLDPSDLTTLPIRCAGNTAVPSVPDDYNAEYGFYNGSLDHLSYDKTEGLHFYSTCAWGDQQYSNAVFYVYFKGDFDRMDLTYIYTNRDVIGGDGWWSKIVSWKVNGTHVYSDDDELYKKVFIRKAAGKTSVTVDKK